MKKCEPSCSTEETPNLDINVEKMSGKEFHAFLFALRKSIRSNHKKVKNDE